MIDSPIQQDGLRLILNSQAMQVDRPYGCEWRGRPAWAVKRHSGQVDLYSIHEARPPRLLVHTLGQPLGLALLGLALVLVPVLAAQLRKAARARQARLHPAWAQTKVWAVLLGHG